LHINTKDYFDCKLGCYTYLSCSFNSVPEIYVLCVKETKTSAEHVEQQKPVHYDVIVVLTYGIDINQFLIDRQQLDNYLLYKSLKKTKLCPACFGHRNTEFEQQPMEIDIEQCEKHIYQIIENCLNQEENYPKLLEQLSNPILYINKFDMNQFVLQIDTDYHEYMSKKSNLFFLHSGGESDRRLDMILALRKQKIWTASQEIYSKLEKCKTTALEAGA
jgi:hypothetical protein